MRLSEGFVDVGTKDRGAEAVEVRLLWRTFRTPVCRL
jgi:hypothetical protein